MKQDNDSRVSGLNRQIAELTESVHDKDMLYPGGQPADPEPSEDRGEAQEPASRG